MKKFLSCFLLIIFLLTTVSVSTFAEVPKNARVSLNMIDMPWPESGDGFTCTKNGDKITITTTKDNVKITAPINRTVNLKSQSLVFFGEMQNQDVFWDIKLNHNQPKTGTFSANKDGLFNKNMLQGSRMESLKFLIYRSKAQIGSDVNFTDIEVIINKPNTLTFSYLFIGEYEIDNKFVDKSQKLNHVYRDNSGYDINIPYRLYIPEDYDEKKSYPILLYLHGSGESGTDNEKQVIGNPMLEKMITPRYKAKYPCIIVVPQTDRGFDGSFLSGIKDIMDQTAKKYNVAKDKRYVVGYSMGSFATWQMISMFPDYFGAAMPMAGGSSVDANRIKHIPIWVCHGAADSTVSPSSSLNMVNQLKSVGGRVYYTEQPGAGHEFPFTILKEDYVYKWLFSDDHPIPPDLTEDFPIIDGVLGDVNGDKEVTTVDALIILRHAAKISEIKPDFLQFADLNKDSKINTVDALLILRKLAGV